MVTGGRCGTYGGMKSVASILLVAAAVAVGTASAAHAPVAHAPGLVVALEGRTYIGGREIARGDQPTWSPSGRQVAYVRGGSVYVVGADGTNERRLTSGRSAAHSSATFPAWSPDGTRVRFAGIRDLFTVTVATAKLARLTRTAQPWLGNFTPAYSPDGKTIAFTRSTDAFNNDIRASAATAGVSCTSTTGAWRSPAPTAVCSASSAEAPRPTGARGVATRAAILRVTTRGGAVW